MCLTSEYTIYQVTIDVSMTAVTGWTVNYQRGDSNDVMMESHDANRNGVVLTGLNKGTSYTISVAASNTAGMGTFTTQTETTQTDRKWNYVILLYCNMFQSHTPYLIM